MLCIFERTLKAQVQMNYEIEIEITVAESN